MVFGKRIVITQYSFAELVRRLHESTEYLNAAINEYDHASNPIEEVTALEKLLHSKIRLQMYEKKLGKAFLSMIDKNINRVSDYMVKTMSNNPQFQGDLKRVWNQIEKNLKHIVMEEQGDGARSNYLIALTKGLVGKAKNSAKVTENKIKANVELLAKQQQKGIGSQKPALVGQR